ncbi:Leukotriene A-4 hydrolase [Toxocara canis]|uniref:Leukotriene A-4 hydrolase n=1 Tax=Toxocara canis TaxID=6265 RepID=A0A0B2VFU8_TOXCA|nr:Leukotriene A-4 hydrolase [Toxocara canis]
MVAKDPASCANFDQVELEKIEVEWTVDFENKILEGETTQTFRTLCENVQFVNLDCRDIVINKLEVNDNSAEYSRSQQIEGKNVFGDKLTIHVNGLPRDSKINVHIRFKTSPQAAALQWMSKEQTTDRLQPTVFTYCQPIGARTILPCMDTPTVKCPLYAKISNIIALVGGIQVGQAVDDKRRSGYKIYTYEQTVPIPSYLISFIVGVFEGRDISHRIRVWAEPSMVSEAEYEFANSEESLKLAEKLFGNYVWKRCDMVVLPKSFPVGGMENPCLIFLSPTLITGDRSETILVIHEQVHAWWGNLVTNARWGDMWLNEGFATYFEQRIGALIYGEKYRQFSGLKTWTSILMPMVFEKFNPNHPFTQLVQDQSGGIDPNDAFSMIYYEKGQVFLYYLEKRVGQEEFDACYRDYLKKFAFKSVDSLMWKQHFVSFFKSRPQLLEDIDFDVWMYGRGMPPLKPDYDDSMQRECTEYAHTWVTNPDAQLRTNAEQLLRHYNMFVPIQRVEFLNLLRNANNALPHSKLELLEEFFHFNSCTNCEVMHLWIRIAIRSRWRPIIPVAYKYVTEFGRLKLIRPIFRDLRAWSATSGGIVEVFKRNIPYMHPAGVEQLAHDLGLQ